MSMLVGFAEIAFDCYNTQNYVPGDLHGWKRSNDEKIGDCTKDNFYACAYNLKNTDIVAIGIRGTDNDRDKLMADAGGIGLGMGALAMNITTALDFTHKWLDRTNNIWLIGHSLGGAFVQIVAGLLNMNGVTFNAPGVLHLVSVYSGHPLTKFGGVVSNPVMQILTELTFGVDVVGNFNKVVAADDDSAFAPVANYRAQNDPVSLAGIHVGAPIQVIRVDPALKIHSMSTIVKALGGAMYFKPVAERG